MIKSLLKPFAFAVVFLFLLGFVFPTLTSIVTEKALPFQSSGSPVTINGKVYGSYMIAEAFNSSVFFHPRPSAIGYNMSTSGGYSYSIDSNQTLNLTQHYIKKFEQENPGINMSQIPEAMVSYSASGLDPNIPVLGAYDQVPRIATAIYNLSLNKSLNLSVSNIYAILNDSINRNERQNFPIFGSYYVNTVELNIDILKLLMAENILPKNFLQ
ncbi:MAG: potassium-transporting ATPase subunit C [Candidatus Thermoplasmatota archaeon]|nr:potassium-transporting ATPase subunit C [Candidatus Thermoplasmatota archaeon]MDA8142767.1 potassium-transporting ATPase subunit C [Thermoplasmatales archaeon]